MISEHRYLTKYKGHILDKSKAKTNSQFTFEITGVTPERYLKAKMYVSYGDKKGPCGGVIVANVLPFNTQELKINASNFKQISKNAATFNIETIAP